MTREAMLSDLSRLAMSVIFGLACVGDHRAFTLRRKCLVAVIQIRRKLYGNEAAESSVERSQDCEVTNHKLV